MKSAPVQIRKIVNLNDYVANKKEFEHLFEVQLPPEGIKLWKPRFNFELGTPLIGDLYLDLEQEKMMEIHPFPEWVVFLKSLGIVNAKPYLVVPNFPKSIVGKLLRKNIEENVSLIHQEISKLTIDDMIAYEYELGVNVLVPAFIPHFFISSAINKEAGESPPYLQVFEPNIEQLTKTLKIKTTYYFELPFTAKI